MIKQKYLKLLGWFGDRYLRPGYIMKFQERSMTRALYKQTSITIRISNFVRSEECKNKVKHKNRYHWVSKVHNVMSNYM